MNYEEQHFFVLKRNGQEEQVHFEKISKRILELCGQLDMQFVDVIAVSQKVVQGLYKGVTTSELDRLAAEVCASMACKHPDYGVLAARIAVSSLHKETKQSFGQVMRDLYEHRQADTRRQHRPLVSRHVLQAAQRHATRIESALEYFRDYDYTYFALRTLENSYLLKLNGAVHERPQHMLMRVALGIHFQPTDEQVNGDAAETTTDTDKLEAALHTYELTSQHWYTHASPTLLHAGRPHPQMCSSFLLPAVRDSLSGIYDSVKRCAMITKRTGGIGLAVHEIRASGSMICNGGAGGGRTGTGRGVSSGLVPMLRLFSDTAHYVEQQIGTGSATEPRYVPVGDAESAEPVDGDNEHADTNFAPQMRRCGAIATYLEPWHADFKAFLQMHLSAFETADKNKENDKDKVGRSDSSSTSNSNNNVEEDHQHVFPGVWMPDLFMQRVARGLDWTLMDPARCPRLNRVCGSRFQALYERYEAEGRGERTLPARTVWRWILRAQLHTGTPSLVFKDAVNRLSNQSHLGVVQCASLCAELVQYSGRGSSNIADEVEGKEDEKDSENEESQLELDDQEISATPLASINLRKFVIGDRHDPNRKRQQQQQQQQDDVNDSWILEPLDPHKHFDYAGLSRLARNIVRTLNRIIDANDWPICGARVSNQRRHRPIAIGVQGLADTFALMGIEWESEAAVQLNRRIFRTLYFAALDASCELATAVAAGRSSDAAICAAHQSFPDSPLSRGELHPDLWRQRENEKKDPREEEKSNIDALINENTNDNAGDLDWTGLRNRVRAHGVRNSLLVAVMPTASTAHLLSNNEAVEPFVSNMHVGRAIFGEFPLVNSHLLRDLLRLRLWSSDVKTAILVNQGSVQHIAGLPDRLKRIYRTAWEIDQRALLRLAADRAAYVDQSQALNLHVVQPDLERVSQLHFLSWRLGLKTAVHYLRTRPAFEPYHFALMTKKRSESSSVAGGTTAAKNNNVSRSNSMRSNSINSVSCYVPAGPRLSLSSGSSNNNSSNNNNNNSNNNSNEDGANTTGNDDVNPHHSNLQS